MRALRAREPGGVRENLALLCREERALEQRVAQIGARKNVLDAEVADIRDHLHAQRNPTAGTPKRSKSPSEQC